MISVNGQMGKTERFTLAVNLNVVSNPFSSGHQIQDNVVDGKPHDSNKNSGL
jgi:hypothetical protein